MTRYLRLVTSHPRAALLAAAAVAAGFGTGLLRLEFDNRPDAFLPPDHAALRAKLRVEDTFGLEDPMLIAVAVVDEEGRPVSEALFAPHPSEPLALVKTLSDAVEKLLDERRGDWGDPGPHPVYSLATEYDVEVIGGVPHDRPFLEPFPTTAQALADLRHNVERLELYSGVIVAEDRSAAAIVVVPPRGRAQEVYDEVRKLVDAHQRPGLRLALGGEAAVRSAMGEAVVSSALRLNPVCVAVVVFFLFLAFRNLTGVMLPMVVVGFGSVVMLGAMCWAGVPVYIITNSILVMVVSLGVADAIHILGEYYRELGRGAVVSRQELAVQVCSRLLGPVVVTSLTDIAGFASFWFTGIMPPLKLYGLLAAVGCGAVLAASLTLLPAALVLLDPAAPRHRKLASWSEHGPLVRALSALGRSVHRFALAWTAAGCALAAAGVWGATGLRIDQSMASTFEETSRIVSDDRLLNEIFHGTYFLDVLVTADREGALCDPEALERIAALETHAKRLDKVNGSISVAGFARKMNQVLNNWDEDFNKIPRDATTVQEHFEIVERSPSKHADLLRLVDRDFRQANVRLRLSSGEFRDERAVVEEMERYIAELFPPGGPLRAELAGRVNLDYHWVRLIVRSHVQSVVLTGAMILLCMVVHCRSLWKGLLAMLPVAFAVVSVYAVMAATEIPLSIGTSMFASLAIGVGINFPIHVIDRTRAALGAAGGDLARAFAEVYSVTAKALVFNALAVCCGFLALLASELPLMRHFGLMIALGIGASCAASLTFLPAGMALAHRFARRGTP
jgi:hypothetical protein